MSVILTGSKDQIVMAAPGRPMLAAPLPAAVTENTQVFSAAAGLAGWWDAGVAPGILDSRGKPLSAFGATAASVADKSGAGTRLRSGTRPPAARTRRWLRRV